MFVRNLLNGTSMHLIQRPFVLVGALALLAFQPLADTVGFHPKDGSEATKNFTLEGTFELGDMSIVVDGQDMSGQIPLDQVAGEFDMAFAIVDRYIKSADGKPLHLERDYTSSNASFSGMDQAESKDDLFEVDGKTVIFKWDADKKEYTRSVKEGEVDEDKLKSLGIDLDYRALLPTRTVAAGDKWEIDPKGVVSALFFGVELQELSSLPIDDPEFAGIADQLMPELQKMIDSFKAQCEYVGPREGGDANLGEVAMTMDSRATADLAAMLASVLETQAAGAGVEFDIGAANLGMRMRGEGKLLWDLAGGHAKSFEMECELELTLEIDMSVSDPNGGEHSAEMSAELMGTAKWTMN